MELRHLFSFATVAEERHFGRAAERLGITQPPLSRQIQQLEAELGVKLFVRNARSVHLTEEGARYLAEILPHLVGLRRAADSARIMSQKLAGKVRAGFISNLAYRVMPDLLKSLRKTAPTIGVELFELPSPEQLRLIRERRIDIGFVMLPIDDVGLKFRSLFREPLVAMIPSGHSLAPLAQVPLMALSKENFVLCPRLQLTGFHEIVLGLCRSGGFVPRVIHEASSKAAMTELVAQGLGVSLVPESASVHEHSGILYKPLASMSPAIETAAVWLDEAMTPVLRAFLDQAIRVTAEKAKVPTANRLTADRP
jgi:DNA-binding transcriptional LysR family regulator